MRISNIPGPSAVLELDREEVITLNNALNEVCNGIDLRGELRREWALHGRRLKRF